MKSKYYITEEGLLCFDSQLTKQVIRVEGVRTTEIWGSAVLFNLSEELVSISQLPDERQGLQHLQFIRLDLVQIEE